MDKPCRWNRKIYIYFDMYFCCGVLQKWMKELESRCRAGQVQIPGLLPTRSTTQER